MKQQADACRSDRSFAIGDLVYVQLQPYRQSSMSSRSNQNLSPLYYGPYYVEDKIGNVACKLRLPTEASVHPVFHVSQLKKSIPANTTVVNQLPAPTVMPPVPVAILDRRCVKRGNQAATKVLIQWSDRGVDEATWEFLFDMQQRFPDINLEDKAV